MSEDPRPQWTFELSEDQVRKINSRVKKITHHWEMTGADTARDWIEFHTKSGKFVAPTKWQTLFEFAPDHAGLIQPNYRGREALKRLAEIDKWEAKNKRDRDEYERLKSKFEN